MTSLRIICFTQLAFRAPCLYFFLKKRVFSGKKKTSKTWLDLILPQNKGGQGSKSALALFLMEEKSFVVFVHKLSINIELEFDLLRKNSNRFIVYQFN